MTEEYLNHDHTSSMYVQGDQGDDALKLEVERLRAQVRSLTPENDTMEAAEKLAIRRALRLSEGNKRSAARILRIGKTTLYRKMNAYDMQTPSVDEATTSG